MSSGSQKTGSSGLSSRSSGSRGLVGRPVEIHEWAFLDELGPSESWAWVELVRWMQIKSRPLGQTRMVSHRVWGRRLNSSSGSVAIMLQEAQIANLIRVNRGKLYMPRVQAAPSTSAMRMRKMRAKERDVRPSRYALAHYGIRDGEAVSTLMGDESAAGAVAAARAMNILAELGAVDAPASEIRARIIQPEERSDLIPYDCVPRLEEILRELTGATIPLR